MKKRLIPILSTALALTAAAWSALAFSAEEPATAEEAAAVEKAQARGRMVSKQQDIIKRLGMSAPMELPEPGEVDFVAEAQANGWIVEATLEEVEAALKAAAATPSPDDDAAAMRLVHRGSYRFYLDENSLARKPATAR